VETGWLLNRLFKKAMRYLAVKRICVFIGILRGVLVFHLQLVGVSSARTTDDDDAKVVPATNIAAKDSCSSHENHVEEVSESSDVPGNQHSSCEDETSNSEYLTSVGSESAGDTHPHEDDQTSDDDSNPITTPSAEQARLVDKCNSMGVPQVLNGENFGISMSTIQSVVEDAFLVYTYMTTPEPTEPQKILDNNMICRNQHEMCIIWAAMGECQSNAPYMEQMCAPVCRSCHTPLLSTVEDPCTKTWDHSSNTWKSGDLDRMFRRLSSDANLLAKHNIQILSSPTAGLNENDDNGGPWIITMEDIISPTEAERLIELGETEGFKASASSSSDNGDESSGESSSSSPREEKVMNSKHRNSYNTWCQDDCYRDETAREVMRRLSDLTGIGESNSECAFSLLAILLPVYCYLTCLRQIHFSQTSFLSCFLLPQTFSY
jgi:hypothetical protein